MGNENIKINIIIPNKMKYVSMLKYEMVSKTKKLLKKIRFTTKEKMEKESMKVWW